MFLKIAKIALALTLLSAGCGSQSEGQSGSGKRAYYQLARAWCERDAQCLEAGGFGQTWASMDACAEYHASFLSTRGTVSCAPETDYVADLAALRTCIAVIGDAPCESTTLYGSLLGSTEDEGLRDCRKVAEQLATLEDERAGAVSLGEPCQGDSACTWDAVCARDGDASCGVCLGLPKAGERCYVDPEEGTGYCALGLLCSEGTCVTSLLPGEGEACLGEVHCAAGLDCDDAGKCERLYEPGDPCNAEAVFSCGSWLRCNEGGCAPHDASPEGKLGDSCGPDQRCTGGRCVDGKCEPLAALGEACPKDCEDCDSDCQNPYVCVDGTCRDVPACGTGKTDDVCSATQQCALGFGCVYSDDGPSYCLPAPSNLGHACLEDTGCIHGQCTAGRCVFAEGGERCEGPRECRSGECIDGRCSEALVCEPSKG